MSNQHAENEEKRSWRSIFQSTSWFRRRPVTSEDGWHNERKNNWQKAILIAIGCFLILTSVVAIKNYTEEQSALTRETKASPPQFASAPKPNASPIPAKEERVRPVTDLEEQQRKNEFLAEMRKEWQGWLKPHIEKIEEMWRTSHDGLRKTVIDKMSEISENVGDRLKALELEKIQIRENVDQLQKAVDANKLADLQLRREFDTAKTDMSNKFEKVDRQFLEIRALLRAPVAAGVAKTERIVLESPPQKNEVVIQPDSPDKLPQGFWGSKSTQYCYRLETVDGTRWTFWIFVDNHWRRLRRSNGVWEFPQESNRGIVWEKVPF